VLLWQRLSSLLSLLPGRGKPLLPGLG